MKLLKNSIPASLFVATAMMTSGLGSAIAADKYLESVEERLERVERELRIIKSDAKGKDILGVDIPVFVKPKSKFVEELKLTGRLHTQFGYVIPTRNSFGGFDENYSTFEIRRARIGIEAKLAGDFFGTVEFQIVPGAAALQNAWVEYRGYDFAKPKAGHYKPTFGFEQNTSSNSIKTVERSNLTNTLTVDEKIGAGFSGEYGPVFYGFGVFNNADNVQAQPGGAIPSSYVYNPTVGVDLSDLIGADVELRFDYANAGRPSTGGAVFNFVHNYAFAAKAAFGGFELLSQFIAGRDSSAAGTRPNNSEFLYGVSVQPSFFVIPKKLELVARYEWMESNNQTNAAGVLVGGRGIRQPGRYAARAGGAFGLAGDNFQAVYGGINYYINGNDLKLMTGVEYSTLKVPRGVAGSRGTTSAVTLYTAVRMAF